MFPDSRLWICAFYLARSVIEKTMLVSVCAECVLTQVSQTEGQKLLNKN